MRTATAWKSNVSPTRGRPADANASARVYYFDVVALLVLGIIGTGHYFVQGNPATPPIARDVAGVWCPAVAVLLLLVRRPQAYRQGTPWIACAFAALTYAAVAAIFWRWHVVAFIGAMLSTAVLLLAGLVLRTKALSERLSRTDLFGLMAAVGSVTMTVALTEAAFRLAFGFFDEETQQLLRAADPDSWGVPHPYIGHLHTPSNSFVLSGIDFRAVHNVDELGFRNSSPWPERAEIVTVGDSVTFGLCVEDGEAWPSLVRQALAPRRLLNLGLIGASPEQYLRVFETFGVNLRPTVLLVGLFPRNDFGDADEFDRWLKSGLGGNYMVWRGFGQPQPLRFSLSDPLDTVSRVFKWSVSPTIRRSYIFASLRAARGGLEWGAPPRIYQFPDGRKLQLLESDFRRQVAQTAPGERQFELVLASLQRLQGVAARAGTRVLVVLLPGKEETYLPLLGVSIPDPTSGLRSQLDGFGIEYLDLTADFRARALRGEQLFFEVDGHPSRAGHAAIAQRVLEHLQKHAAYYGLAD